MLRFDIINDSTGTRATGNYNYYVYVTTTDGGLREIARGHFAGHDRASGWTKLVEQIALQARVDEIIDMYDPFLLDKVL